MPSFSSCSKSSGRTLTPRSEPYQLRSPRAMRRGGSPSTWEKAIRDAVLAFDDVRVQPQRLPLDWETSYAGKTIGDLMRLTDDELKAIGRRHALKRMAAETKPPAGAEPPPEPPAGLGKKDEPKR